MRKVIFRILIGFVISTSVSANDSIYLTGLEISKSNSYYYIGYISALPNSKLGNGFVQRIWIDHLSYEYSGGSGYTEAKAPGVSYSVGFQKSNEQYSFGAYLGVQDRNTKLSPNDPSNTSNGNNFAVITALDFTKKFSNSHSLELMGNHSPEIGYWSRIRYIHQRDLSFGPEFSVQGNDSYRNTKIGLFIGNIKIVEKTTAQLRIGHSKNDDLRGSTYFGIDINRSF